MSNEFKTVPVVPTEAMIRAGVDSDDNQTGYERVKRIYSHMIQAAPDCAGEVVNQCDGCRAGFPVDKNGHHIVPYPSGSMACEKDKYTAQPRVVDVEAAKNSARYLWLRENCFDTKPAGEGDAFAHPALYFSSDLLQPYLSKSMDEAIDSELEKP